QQRRRRDRDGSSQGRVSPCSPSGQQVDARPARQEREIERRYVAAATAAARQDAEGEAAGIAATADAARLHPGIDQELLDELVEEAAVEQLLRIEPGILDDADLLIGVERTGLLRQPEGAERHRRQR